MIKKFFKYSSVVFIFSVSLIIVINNFRIQNAEDLSHAEKYLKHLTADHKINDVRYDFIQINFSPDNYVGKATDREINIVSSVSSFLLPLNVNIYQCSAGNNFSAEKILFNAGFKISHLQPPKYYS